MGILVKECRDCGREVVWLKTQKGKNILVDYDSVREDEAITSEESNLYDYARHSCHWETCPSKKADRGSGRAPSRGRAPGEDDDDYPPGL